MEVNGLKLIYSIHFNRPLKGDEWGTNLICETRGFEEIASSRLPLMDKTYPQMLPPYVRRIMSLAVAGGNFQWHML